jgi:hypothetical protein
VTAPAPSRAHQLGRLSRPDLVALWERLARPDRHNLVRNALESGVTNEQIICRVLDAEQARDGAS